MDRTRNITRTRFSVIWLWIGHLYTQVKSSLWCYFFGSQLLVYLTTFGYTAADRAIQELRRHQTEFEESQVAYQTALGRDLTSIGRSLEQVRSEVSRQKLVLLTRLEGRLEVLIHLGDNLIRQNSSIRDVLYEIRQIVAEPPGEARLHRTPEGRFNQIYSQARNTENRDEQNRLFNELAAFTDGYYARRREEEREEEEEEEEEVETRVSPVQTTNSETTLYNDYSGNEEPHPDSPIGSPVGLEGEQTSSQEVHTQTSPLQEQVYSRDEDNLVQTALRRSNRRGIRAAVWGDSSPNSDYPDSSSGSSSYFPSDPSSE